MKLFTKLTNDEQKAAETFNTDKYFVVAVGSLDEVKTIGLKSRYYQELSEIFENPTKFGRESHSVSSPEMSIAKLDGAQWQDTDSGGWKGGDGSIRSTLFVAYDLREGFHVREYYK